jgi:VIT1/CCC1 family predicted Fe2+/Mn2+ transporter
MSIHDNWHEEKQSAWLYRRLTGVERDPVKRRLFAALADAAESQAGVWARQAAQAHEALPAEFRPDLRARVVAQLAGWLGPHALRPVLAAMKVRGMSAYQSLPLRLGHSMPTSVEQVGARHRGVGAGANLRAAVFGVNDGLVSNTSLVMGVAGATGDPGLIVVSGVAGLLAGAFSMAAGEYVSMRSQRELFEYQIGLEREELAEYPEEEAEELALIYRARGLPMAEARATAQAMMKDGEHALDVLAREELGLNPEELGSPWGAALFSFVAFAIGAAIPLAPFALGIGANAILLAAALSAVTLFAIGAILSLFTGRRALWSGLRMVTIGIAAGGVTWLIGRWLGVSLA